MKTILLGILTFLLLFSLLCACGRQPTSADPTPSGSIETQAASSADSVSTLNQPETLSEANEAELYAAYLTNGGYSELLPGGEDPEADYEAQACLADINEDGVRELLMHITNKSEGGVRGFPSVTILLGVQDGKVKRLGFASYGGGSGGGDYLFIRFDTRTEKHVLEYEEFVRDGMFFNTLAHIYFDVHQTDTEEKQYGLTGSGDVVYKAAHTLRMNTFYKEGAYAQDAQNVLDQTDLCEEEDGFITAYLLDDDYISKAEYDEMRARFVEPTDPAYQMKSVTLQSPIPSD